MGEARAEIALQRVTRGPWPFLSACLAPKPAGAVWEKPNVSRRSWPPSSGPWVTRRELAGATPCYLTPTGPPRAALQPRQGSEGSLGSSRGGQGGGIPPQAHFTLLTAKSALPQGSSSPSGDLCCFPILRHAPGFFAPLRLELSWAQQSPQGSAAWVLLSRHGLVHCSSHPMSSPCRAFSSWSHSASSHC